MDFASTVSNKVTDKVRGLVKNTYKSFLLDNKGQTWVKQNGGLFDNTMGSFDGAETAELVGLYLLDKVKKILPNAGLYRDDGIAMDRLNKQQWSRLEK